MKKFLIAIFTLLATTTFLALPIVASAQFEGPYDDICNNAGTGSDSVVCQNQDPDNPISGPDGVIMRVVGMLSWVIGVAAVIIIIIAGLKYITSAGDPKAIASAKDTLLYAVIGIVLFLTSQAILRFVVGSL